MKRYHIIFKGRVQGVGFRYTSKNIANKYKLTGSVKNLDNGDVEMYIQGEDDSIEKFLQELENQHFIRITSTDMNEMGVAEGESDFEITA